MLIMMTSSVATIIHAVSPLFTVSTTGVVAAAGAAVAAAGAAVTAASAAAAGAVAAGAAADAAVVAEGAAAGAGVCAAANPPKVRPRASAQLRNSFFMGISLSF